MCPERNFCASEDCWTGDYGTGTLINYRIELLERRIAEAEKVEVAEMVQVANLTPEQLAALLQQNANTTPNSAALAAVGANTNEDEP